MQNEIVMFIAVSPDDYGMFSFDETGDLLIRSNKGLYWLSKASFEGDSFRHYLSTLDSHFILTQFTSHTILQDKAVVKKSHGFDVEKLLTAFINALKTQVQ